MYRLFQKLTCKGTNTADNSFHRRQKGYQRADRAVHFTGLGESVCIRRQLASPSDTAVRPVCCVIDGFH